MITAFRSILCRKGSTDSNFVAVFGMSETLLVTITDHDKISVNSVGKPFPNIEMRILDLATRETLQPFEKVKK